MSKDDYARILIHAPTRLVLILVAALGSGAGMYRFFGAGNDVQIVERELDVCQTALADIRGIAWQYENDIAELVEWSAKTLAAIGPVQRMGALNSAPPVYTFARGSISR